MGCGETEDRKWEIQDWNVPQLGNYRNSSPLMITLHSLLFYLLVLELTDLQLQVERNSVLILASPPQLQNKDFNFTLNKLLHK